MSDIIYIKINEYNGEISKLEENAYLINDNYYFEMNGFDYNKAGVYVYLKLGPWKNINIPHFLSKFNISLIKQFLRDENLTKLLDG